MSDRKETRCTLTIRPSVRMQAAVIGLPPRAFEYDPMQLQSPRAPWGDCVFQLALCELTPDEHGDWIAWEEVNSLGLVEYGVTYSPIRGGDHAS